MIRFEIALRRERVPGPRGVRARKMTFFFAALALLLHLVPGAVKPTQAQSSHKDDIVFNLRRCVCAMSATGQPCTPLHRRHTNRRRWLYQVTAGADAVIQYKMQ
jgi:hypothetical protein